MKTTKLLIVACALSLNVAFAQENTEKTQNFPPIEDRYLGQKPPGLTPEVFAPGIVSVDGRYEYGVCFSPDLHEMYFTPTVNGHSEIYFSKLENKIWTSPKKADFTKGQVSDEFSPCVSPNGNRIYFTTYDLKFPLKIWYVNRFKDSWSEAIPLDSPLNNDEVINMNEAKNGDLFYINSSKGKMYYAPKKHGKFRKGKELEIEYGSQGFISPSQDFILVEAHKENDKSKDKDVYVCFKKKNGTWSKPINLGSPVNSQYREGSPTITPDGKYLFFNRYDEESGNPNIYWVSAEVINKVRPTEL